MSPVERLKSFQPRHEFFIGIDSDGCVFDTMEIKQKECFIPNIVKFFDLQVISKYVRECAEFINLYSKWRGTNRFPALVKTFEMLAERPEVKERGANLPDVTCLKNWIAGETKLGMPALKAKVAEDPDPLLQRVLAWSTAVDAVVADMVKGVSPFPGVVDVLKIASERADMIVVSQTPAPALIREWGEHNVDSYMAAIAGQEIGTKCEQLTFAAVGKYPAEKILMIGDALGDLKAARDAGTLFFPILPGHESESWHRLHDEGLDRFFSGRFAGDYERELCAEFEAFLPSIPPWEK